MSSSKCSIETRRNRSDIIFSNRPDSPIIEVQGYHLVQEFACPNMPVYGEWGVFVHEHLVRERSDVLGQMIDNSDVRSEDGKIIIEISAYHSVVGHWVKWLYGQPMFTHHFNSNDEVLQDFVDMYCLAHKHDDFTCANVCLDAIRDLFFEEDTGLQEPIDKLKPMLELDAGSDKALGMIVDVLVYGPCSGSGKTKEWLKVLEDYYPLRDWSLFWQRVGSAFAAKVAAQASEDLQSMPDFMAEHAYHLRAKGEKICCGRSA